MNDRPVTGLLDALPPGVEVVPMPVPEDHCPRALSWLEITRRDPTPRPYTTLKALAGYVAACAVSQSPYAVPAGLAEVLEAFQAAATPDFLDFHGVRMRQFGPRELEDYLRRVLLPLPQVQAWNEPRSHHGHQVVFRSAFSRPAPDDDFIDLDALVRNIAALTLREELISAGEALPLQGKG